MERLDFIVFVDESGDHGLEIRKQLEPFVFLQDQAKRDRFMRELDDIIGRVEFTIVSAVIDNRRFHERYAKTSNPYEIALTLCMERSYAFLRDRGQQGTRTAVVVERRGQREDEEMEPRTRIRRGGRRRGRRPTWP